MKTEARTGRPVRFATLTMAGLATLAVELALAAPGHPPLTVLASASALLVAPMLVAAWWLGPRAAPALAPAPRRPVSKTTEVIALALLLTLPFASQPAMAACSGEWMPPEVVLMSSLRNLGLGLAAMARRPPLSKLAAMVSLFLAMVASAMGDGLPALVAVGAYSVAGVLWLMFAYWEWLSPSGGDGRRSGPPALAMAAWASAIALLVAAGVAIGPAGAATILGELVPSSGGTGENDPNAQGGVNDGDNEVAASKDPKSIGFTDSEVSLESDRPSLYDSFSDMYGEPIKPKGEHQKMVSMAPREGRQKGRPTENLHAARSFPTVRQRPNRREGNPADRAAKALFYVKGPTPLHLALTTYDHLDGATWSEEPFSGQHCPLEKVPGEKWLKLDRPAPKGGAGLVAHQFKIGALDSSPLPVPAHLARFRVGSVDRPDFFGWAQDGLVRMVGRTVPAGTVIGTEARTIDPRRLREVDVEPANSYAAARYLEVPGALDPAASRLIRSWAVGQPAGWARVEAVVAAIRGRCVHDRDATVPGGCTDVVGHFLLGSRRGPDHQFASAAAVALRLLGYPSRVVGGYHASPGRYDAKTRHTPVTAEDVHFWAEVMLPGGTWVAIEPTPGYELMAPALSLGERVADVLLRGWARLKANAAATIAGVALMAVAIAFRRAILDGISTFSWRVATRGGARGRVVRTLKLLDQRSRRAGLPRPPGRTPSRWYGPLCTDVAPGSRAGVGRLVAMVDWACYAPGPAADRLPWSDGDVRSTCEETVRDWTLRRLLALRRSSLPEVMPS